MKLYSTLYNSLYNFVILTSKLYKIDESHALKHSMDVFYLSNKLYESELKQNPQLQEQKLIIDSSAILHDMCDKKYIDQKEGLNRIKNHMVDVIPINDLNVILEIISTMSYSTVKKNGFPNLNEYQMAYDIVREADLLTSYDYERSIIYNMYRNNESYIDSIQSAKDLFRRRVFKYNRDNLFKLEYSKKLSSELYIESLRKINLIDRSIF